MTKDQIKKLMDEHDALDDALADGLLRGAEKAAAERRIDQIERQVLAARLKEDA